jgi:hypothetical protein
LHGLKIEVPVPFYNLTTVPADLKSLILGRMLDVVGVGRRSCQVGFPYLEIEHAFQAAAVCYIETSVPFGPLLCVNNAVSILPWLSSNVDNIRCPVRYPAEYNAEYTFSSKYPISLIMQLSGSQFKAFWGRLFGFGVGWVSPGRDFYYSVLG